MPDPVSDGAYLADVPDWQYEAFRRWFVESYGDGDEGTEGSTHA